MGSPHVAPHVVARRGQAMYDENCFEVGSAMPRGRFASDAAMCYEEKKLEIWGKTPQVLLGKLAILSGNIRVFLGQKSPF